VLEITGGTTVNASTCPSCCTMNEYMALKSDLDRGGDFNLKLQYWAPDLIRCVCPETDSVNLDLVFVCNSMAVKPAVGNVPDIILTSVFLSLLNLY